MHRTAARPLTVETHRRVLAMLATAAMREQQAAAQLVCPECIRRQLETAIARHAQRAPTKPHPDKPLVQIAKTMHRTAARPLTVETHRRVLVMLATAAMREREAARFALAALTTKLLPAMQLALRVTLTAATTRRYPVLVLAMRDIPVLIRVRRAWRVSLANIRRQPETVLACSAALMHRIAA